MEGRGAAVVGRWTNGSYEDETPVFANEAPKRGRARIGNTHPSSVISPKKHTLHMHAKPRGVLHWDLSDRNADTNEIERVAIDAVGAMKSGETVI